MRETKTSRSRFQTGSGCYTCKTCGRRTRATGNLDNEFCELCAECYEVSGISNSVSDGLNDPSFPEYLKEMIKRIEKKGGNASHAKEVLAECEKDLAETASSPEEPKAEEKPEEVPPSPAPKDSCVNCSFYKNGACYVSGKEIPESEATFSCPNFSEVNPEIVRLESLVRSLENKLEIERQKVGSLRERIKNYSEASCKVVKSSLEKDLPGEVDRAIRELYSVMVKTSQVPGKEGI